MSNMFRTVYCFEGIAAEVVTIGVVIRIAGWQWPRSILGLSNTLTCTIEKEYAIQSCARIQQLLRGVQRHGIDRPDCLYSVPSDSGATTLIEFIVQKRRSGNATVEQTRNIHRH
ncbi:hypothetical protein VTO73DRAFT_11209 [Trametes versicolor]